MKKIIIIALLLIAGFSTAQTSADSLHLKMYIADRDNFVRLQETVSSKNQYIGLQWCIDLLNQYIELEKKYLAELSKKK